MNDEREKLIEVFCSILGGDPEFQTEEAIEFVDELIANGVCLKENQATSDESKRDVVNTNADRIRDMSNNKLAEHLVDIGWDCHLCSEHERLDNEPLLRYEKCDEQCAKHCLEWLQKPAE